MSSVPWNFRPSMSRYPELWRGCVGCWYPGAGPQGTRLYDFSGYGNHGTLTNMDPATDWVADRFGSAIELDGSNDFVRVLHNTIHSPASITVSMWVKPGTLSGSALQGFVSKSASQTNGWYLFRFSSTLFFNIHRNSAGTASASKTTLVAGVWQHVCGRYDANTGALQAFLNGVPGSTTTTSGPITASTTDLSIGNGYTTTQYADDRIAEVVVYDRAVPDSVIRWHAAHPPGAMFQQRPRRSYFLPSASAAAGLLLRRRRLIACGG